MPIGTITIESRADAANGLKLFKCSFAGDSAYPTHGSTTAQTLLRAAGRREDADLDTVLRLGVHEVQLSDRPRVEVRAHLWRDVELDLLQHSSIFAGNECGTLLGHVRQRGKVRWDD